MQKAHSLDKTSYVNIALATLICVLLAYYIIVANSIASWSYRVEKLSQQLFSASEVSSTLMAQRSSLESTGLLVNFAKTNNMVEAQNVLYLFENKNVALRP